MKRRLDKNFLIPLSRNESLKPHPRLLLVFFLSLFRQGDQGPTTDRSTKKTPELLAPNRITSAIEFAWRTTRLK